MVSWEEAAKEILAHIKNNTKPSVYTCMVEEDNYVVFRMAYADNLDHLCDDYVQVKLIKGHLRLADIRYVRQHTLYELARELGVLLAVKEV